MTGKRFARLAGAHAGENVKRGKEKFQNKQKQRQKQSNDSLCQKRFLLLIDGIVINSVLVH